MLRRACFYLRIYLLLQSVHIRTALMYEADFLIGVLGVALTQGAGIAFVWTVFQNIPNIEGWTLWEVALLYALVVIPRGLTELLCDGQWQLRALVNRGEFDRLLVRPLPPLLQLITQFSSIHGLGSISLGIIILGQSLIQLQLMWGLKEITLLLLALVNGVILMSSVNLLTNCIAFWDPAASSSFPFLIQQFVDFSKFPLSLYNNLLQFVLTWVVPFAFVSYYPGIVLLKKTEGNIWLSYVTPLSGIIFASVATFVWQRGLSHYQSTGN